MSIKCALYSSVISLSLFVAGSAHCQQAVEPKLRLQNIVFNPINYQSPDGFYNAGFQLALERGPNNPQFGFSVQIPHVRTLDEAFDKLKPAIDDLAGELKKAAEDFHPPH
jgi:hypothetical protein